MNNTTEYCEKCAQDAKGLRGKMAARDRTRELKWFTHRCKNGAWSRCKGCPIHDNKCENCLDLVCAQ